LDLIGRDSRGSVGKPIALSLDTPVEFEVLPLE
jgi:hypothetical protein